VGVLRSSLRACFQQRPIPVDPPTMRAFLVGEDVVVVAAVVSIFIRFCELERLMQDFSEDLKT
jgi:hypothetical protein